MFHADKIDPLCSNKDLIIRAEHHERQLLRLEQERDAMETKYEVRRPHIACDREPNFPQEAVKKLKASQAELDAIVQSLESL
jgi:hypothetical protein